MKFLIILIIQASLSQLLFAGPGVRGDYVQIPDDPNMPSRPQSKKSTQLTQLLSTERVDPQCLERWYSLTNLHIRDS